MKIQRSTETETVKDSYGIEFGKTIIIHLPNYYTILLITITISFLEDEHRTMKQLFGEKFCARRMASSSYWMVLDVSTSSECYLILFNLEAFSAHQ